jgi:hypothetical protein
MFLKKIKIIYIIIHFLVELLFYYTHSLHIFFLYGVCARTRPMENYKKLEEGKCATDMKASKKFTVLLIGLK